MTSSAATVRPARPGTPADAASWLSEVGGTPVAGTSVGTRGQAAAAGRPRRNANSRRMPQRDGSPPTTACPTPGTITRCARSAAATRAEPAGGVRRSSPPWSTSAGTAG